MTTPSEGPYARHGSADATVDQRKRLYALTGRQHVWTVAHATVGEWREWRRVCEENGIFDPLNLRGFEDFIDNQEIIVPIEVDAEDGNTEDENFSTDLGRFYDLDYLSPELEGEGSLQVTDLEGSGFTVGEDFSLAFKAPGEASYGTATNFKVSNLKDPVGATAVPHAIFMLSASGQYGIVVTLDLDTFLVFWFLREIPITFTPSSPIERDHLVVPTLELPRGRGEA